MSPYRTNQVPAGKRLRTRWVRLVLSPRWRLSVPYCVCAISIATMVMLAPGAIEQLNSFPKPCVNDVTVIGTGLTNNVSCTSPSTLRTAFDGRYSLAYCTCPESK